MRSMDDKNSTTGHLWGVSLPGNLTLTLTISLTIRSWDDKNSTTGHMWGASSPGHLTLTPNRL